MNILKLLLNTGQWYQESWNNFKTKSSIMILGSGYTTQCNKSVVDKYSYFW
jgi:hypothetical protein